MIFGAYLSSKGWSPETCRKRPDQRTDRVRQRALAASNSACHWSLPWPSWFVWLIKSLYSSCSILWNCCLSTFSPKITSILKHMRSIHAVYGYSSYCDISPASIWIGRTKILPREDQGVWLQQAAPPALRASPPRDATFRPPGLFVQQNRCGLDTACCDLQLFLIAYKMEIDEPFLWFRRFQSLGWLFLKGWTSPAVYTTQKLYDSPGVSQYSWLLITAPKPGFVNLVQRWRRRTPWWQSRTHIISKLYPLVN